MHNNCTCRNGIIPLSLFLMELNCFLSESNPFCDSYHSTGYCCGDMSSFSDSLADDFHSQSVPLVHNVSSYLSIALPEIQRERDEYHNGISMNSISCANELSPSSETVSTSVYQVIRLFDM